MIKFDEMLKTARMAVRLCTSVKCSEDVLIVTDTNKVKIANVLAKASKEIGAETAILIMTPRQMHGNEPPKMVAAAMKAVDVIFTPTTYAMTHTDAMVNAIESGARAIILRGITEEMMVKGAMTANYEELKQRSEKLVNILKGTHIIQITSDYGSDVVLSIKNRPTFVLAGFATEPKTFAALPDGEVATSPEEGSTEGIIVFDHAMDGIGFLSEPIKLRVKKGKVVEISGGKEAKQLSKMVEAADDGAKNIAEFAIGTNRKALFIGNMAEDKKREGSVHIAIGDNHTLGGTVKSALHLDGLIAKPTVMIDSEVIIKKGKLLI